MLYKEGFQVYTAVNIEMQKVARLEVKKGLRAMDQRQGYRGRLKHLKKEEIEDFSKEIEEKSIEQPLEAEAVSEGVVIKVDDEKGEVLVRMGKEQGVIKIDTMRWARKPNPEIAFYSVKIKRPGQVLKTGDVIEVKAVEKNEETGLWDLLLEQKPIAEAALLCIAGETGHVNVMVGGRDFKIGRAHV